MMTMICHSLHKLALLLLLLLVVVQLRLEPLVLLQVCMLTYVYFTYLNRHKLVLTL
jgi:hypothetical protein